MLRRCAQSLSPIARRQIFGYPLTPSYALSRLQRQVADVEREMDKWMGTSMFADRDYWRPVSNPTELESYRLLNPIVDEDGKKMFKLEFDVRRFKPEEVNVKTSSKDNTLSIEAKHDDDHSKFSFFRKTTIPQGVVLQDMSCRFSEDGVLCLSAPYNPPSVSENPNLTRRDTAIPITHESNTEGKKNGESQQG